MKSVAKRRITAQPRKFWLGHYEKNLDKRINDLHRVADIWLGKGWTYTELSIATGVSPATLSRLFNRRTTCPHDATLWRVAKAGDALIEFVLNGRRMK